MGNSNYRQGYKQMYNIFFQPPYELLPQRWDRTLPKPVERRVETPTTTPRPLEQRMKLPTIIPEEILKPPDKLPKLPELVELVISKLSLTNREKSMLRKGLSFVLEPPTIRSIENKTTETLATLEKQINRDFERAFVSDMTRERRKNIKIGLTTSEKYMRPLRVEMEPAMRLQGLKKKMDDIKQALRKKKHRRYRPSLKASDEES